MCKCEGLVIDLRRAEGLMITGTGMQVLVSEDAEIEDFKKRLKDAMGIIKLRDAQIAGLLSEIQDANCKAAELEADLKQSKVCPRMRVGVRLLIYFHLLYNGQGRNQTRTRANLHVHTCPHISRSWRRCKNRTRRCNKRFSV